MKKTLSFILPCLVMLLGCLATASAQNEWTLERCIQYAWDNNISIQQQVLAAEQSSNQLFQTKMNLIPSIGASAGYSFGWGLAETRVETSPGSGEYVNAYVDKATQNFGPSISASINLFEGLSKINNIKRSAADYQATKEETDKLRNTIALSIARAYLQVLLSEELLNVRKASKESVKEQLERTKKLVAAGSQPLSNQLEIEAQLAREELQYVDAENQLNINYLSLRQLLDFPSETDFQITTPNINMKEMSFIGEDIDNVFSLAQNLPQIKASEFRLQSAEYALASARGRFWPTLSFGASYGSSYYHPYDLSFSDQLKNNRNTGIRFGINIPIFSNWNIRTNAKNAELSTQIARLEVENTRKTLYKEIQQASTDASSAYKRYSAAERNLEAMTESFRYTEQKFDVGMLNATDYTVAKSNLLQANSELLQAKYQFVFQLKIIDFYKGIPITL